MALVNGLNVAADSFGQFFLRWSAVRVAEAVNTSWMLLLSAAVRRAASASYGTSGEPTLPPQISSERTIAACPAPDSIRHPGYILSGVHYGGYKRRARRLNRGPVPEIRFENAALA